MELDLTLTTTTLSSLDTTCSMLGSGTFVAWYGSSTRSAKERLGSASGWVRPDGRPVANTPDDLANGRMYYPLVIDEHDNPVAGADVFVATATLDDANATYTSAADCLTGAPTGTYGVADGEKGSWTNGGAIVCAGAKFHIYCLQIERAATVAMPDPPTGAYRHAFLYSDTIAGASGSGTMAFDAACDSDATKHGLGSAVALVSTSATAAADLLTAGVPYVRPDGVVVFDEQHRRLAAIDVTLDHVYMQSEVWAGSRDIGSAALAGETCSDWTNGGENARTGDSSRSAAGAFGGLTGSLNCANTRGLYCIER